ncbi:hypothetical protein H0H92_009624 [Tricholoma furcatifolium]|nr:hypothetical protein H0H92_009624 [Tricholoma furcatifolium]
MPSTLRKTQNQALTLTRSLATVFKSKIFLSKKNETCSPYADAPIASKYEISRPRQLRRSQIPPFKHAHFIHDLPSELLALVFILGAEDDAMFPVRVSHVCRKWREIALHSPSLWRRIMLSPDIDMWKERISRAGACTLDIQLLPWRPTPERRLHYVDALAVQLCFLPVTSFVRRWRSLEIAFADYSPYLWNAALSGCCSRSRRAQAPALQDLTLIYRANDDAKEFCLFAGYAPRLRSVTLDGIKLTWLPSLFKNLTFLDYSHHGFSVGHQAVHDVIAMLEVSSRLVELRLTFPPKRRSVPSIRSQPVDRRVLLLSLQQLHLRVEGSDILYELACVMTLVLTPSLASLCLIDAGHRRLSFPNLKSFFYVYAIPPSLRSLRVEHGWYNYRMVSPIVSSLPQLRQLVIRRPHMPDQVLNLNSRNRKEHWARDLVYHGHPQVARAPSYWESASSSKDVIHTRPSEQ